MVAVEGEGQGKGWRKGLRVFSPEYYAVCAAGGMLSAGTTHLAITPLDVLKVNMQVNPVKYNSILSGLQILVKEQGPSSLWRGWAGKFYGYGANGGCKFGLYEYFKKMYSDVLGGQNRTFIYLISSASAQAIADVALCPFEAVKVRVQTQPKFGKGLVDGFPKLYATEGLSGFYKGLFPLWGRNIPCVDDDDEPQIHSVFGNVRRSFRKDLKDSLSIEPGIKITEEDSDSLVELRVSIIMFSSFEHSVDLLYRMVIQKKKEDCSRAQQLGVTCVAGYASGAVATFVSTPADNIFASLYHKRANNVLQAVKSIGVANLFTRSLPVRITLIGPVVTLQWFLYDTIKVLTGLPTSGGIIHDDVEVV